MQLETPGSCAILRGVHLVPSHYFGEASSTPDGCRARRDEVLNYSAVLGIILQGLVMSILPGMKSHTPEPGYTTMYNEWGGGADWGVISVPPRPPQPPTWLRGVSRLRQDFECSQCFERVFLLLFTCRGDEILRELQLNAPHHSLFNRNCNFGQFLQTSLLLCKKAVMETQRQIHGVSKNFLPPL